MTIFVEEKSWVFCINKTKKREKVIKMQGEGRKIKKTEKYFVKNVEIPSNPYKICTSERMYNRSTEKNERSRKNEETNEL